MPQQPAVYSKLSVAENLRLFARLEKRRRPRGGGRRGCSSRPGCANAPTTSSARCRAATGSASTSRSGCWPSRPCCCSTSRRRRSTRASASGCGSSSATLAAQRGTTVVFSTHNVGEAERYADRVLVLADGELLFAGTPAELTARSTATGGDFETAFVALPARARATRSRCAGCCSRTSRSCAARRCSSGCWSSTRSSIALLIGIALSRGPDKPKVAFVNEMPAGEHESTSVGSDDQRRELRRELFESVQPVTVDTRAEAIEKVALGRGAGRADHPGGHHEQLQTRSTARLGRRRRSRSSTTRRPDRSASSSSRRSTSRSPTPTRR